MRTLFLGTVLALILYIVTQPACQYHALHQAKRAAEEGRFDTAWTYLLPVFEEKPFYFYNKAKVLCGQISIQQARALATQPEPNFGEAARLLRNQSRQCQGYESPRTQPLLEKVASLHLAHASTQCEHKNFDPALRAFQDIATLAYSERLQHEATEEAAWCRLAYANDLTERGWFAEAFEQLGRASGSGHATIRRAALKQVPLVVEKEVIHWIESMQYIQAFRVFTERRQHFGREPEVASFFPRMEGLMQMQVFGMILTQPCIGKADRPKGERPTPVVAVKEQPSGFATTNMTLVNNTGYDLQVLLRGPENDVFRLKPKESKPLLLAFGDYLVGMFAPGQCWVQPKQTAWSVEPFIHQAIEVVLHGQD